MVTISIDANFKVTDAMVGKALVWIDASLAFDIPVMTEYAAFSRKLLEVAVSTDNGDAFDVIEEMVDRSLEFFADSMVMDVSGIITDPVFVNELLHYALLGRVISDVAMSTQYYSTVLQ